MVGAAAARQTLLRASWHQRDKSPRQGQAEQFLLTPLFDIEHGMVDHVGLAPNGNPITNIRVAGDITILTLPCQGQRSENEMVGRRGQRKMY